MKVRKQKRRVNSKQAVGQESVLCRFRVHIKVSKAQLATFANAPLMKWSLWTPGVGISRLPLPQL